MTVFNGDDNQNTSTSQTTEDTSNQSYVKKLVETRGDQWSDPEVIAKGKIEADTYIEQLKAQLAELQEKNAKASRVDDLVAKIEQEAAKTTNANAQSQNKGGAEDSNTKNPVSEDDIQSLVEKALTSREQQNTVKQNLAQVNSHLDEMYGTEADSIVQKKAQELGLSKQRLQEVAAESPTAFFNLIGDKPKNFKPMVNGSVRTESVNMQQTGTRDFKFYQKLRKENPRQFAQAQEQMVQDRLKLGDAFYN
jgi:hypothetical protein